MMELPSWPPIALWIGSVLVVGLKWLSADMRFRRAHLSRHGGYRTAEQGMELFARDPVALLPASVLLAFGGLFASFILVASVERVLNG